MGPTETRETLQGPASIGPLWRVFQMVAMLTAVSWLVSYVFYMDGYTALVRVFAEADSVFWIVGGTAYFLSPVISVVLIGMSVKPEVFAFLNRGDRLALVSRTFLLLIPIFWLGTVFVGAPSMINPMLQNPLSQSEALPIVGGSLFHAVFQHWFQGFAAILLALVPERFATITESERPAGTGAVVREATRQVEMDRRLKALREATEAMKEARTPDEVASIAADAAQDVLGLQSSRVHLHDDESDELVPSAWTEEVAEALDGDPSTIDGGAGFVWDTFRTGDATYYPDHRGEVEDDSREPVLQSSFLLPLGEHGILLAQSTEPTELTDPEIELAHVLSANTQAALDSTEDERELVLLRALVDRTSDSTVVVDAESRAVLDANDAACRQLGYTDEELHGLALWDILGSVEVDGESGGDTESGDRSAGIQGLLDDARSGTKTTVAAEYRRSDGSTVPVELTCHHVELDQEYFLAIASELTDAGEGEGEGQGDPSLMRDIRSDVPTSTTEDDEAGIELPDKGDCLLSIRRHRWPDGVCCPHCGGEDTIKKGTTSKGAKRYRCHDCEQTFNDLTGTLFAEHRLTLPEMFYIIQEMEDAKTAEIAQDLDRSYQSVLEFVHEIQRASREDVGFAR